MEQKSYPLIGYIPIYVHMHLLLQPLHMNAKQKQPVAVKKGTAKQSRIIILKKRTNDNLITLACVIVLVPYS